MGGGKYSMNSSQFEFIKSDIEYSRKGGCFVTTPKAIIYVFIAIAISLSVGFLVYYYGPNSQITKKDNKQEDIEKLLNNSLENLPKQDIRLQKNLNPTYYKIKLDPIDTNNNFTLKGEVTIFFECKSKAKSIVLNAENLNILTVYVALTQRADARSKRSVPEEALVTEPRETTTVGKNDISTAVVPETTKSDDKTTVDVKQKDATIIGSTTVLPSTTLSTTSFPSITSTPTTETSISNTMQPTSSSRTRIENFEPRVTETSEARIKDQKQNMLNSKYTIYLVKELVQGKNYSVKITYTTNISESFQGLYHTSYMNENQNISLLATQFQPIYARNVFPCFDEPSFKAPVQFTIGKRINQTVLSNYPLITSFRNESNVIWDNFEPTRPLSTYSLGFVVADFDILATIDIEPKVQIWARKMDINTEFAVEAIRKILRYLEKYFEIKYPFPKVDFVIIRGLPSVSTMSSGLICVKESLFLNLESNDAKKKLFGVIARSLIKAWMGGLVSINWWSDFWFLQGFSIFMEEELAMNTQKWESEFSLQITHQTLDADDFKSAHSLQINVVNNLQISGIFNWVEHYKGSCLLKMLNNSLAPITFQKGVQIYLKIWQDKSAGVQEFWKSLDTAITEIDDLPKNKTISDIMQTWTTQTSYPLITVSINITTGSIIVNQTKFHTNSNHSDSSLWFVPINYMIGGHNDSQVKRLWLTERSVVVHNINFDLNDTWILFNIEQTGYYRVNYDTSNWRLLINILKLNYTKIPAVNRGQLINDAFELAANAILSYQIPFDLSQYLATETHYVPWASVLNSFHFIKSILQTTYLNGAYEDYISNLVSKLFDTLGPEDKPEDTNNEKQLRKLIVETACGVNYENCTKWAVGQMKKLMENSTTHVLSSNRKTVLCTGIRLGNRAEFDYIFQRLRSDESSTDVQDLYLSLGCTKQQWLINRYLQSILNGTIEWQNVAYVWQSIRHVPSISFGFKFLRENWHKIYAIYKDKKFVLRTIIKDFLSILSTRSDLEDLTLFFSMHEKDLQEFSHLFQGVVDGIKARIEWEHNYLDIIDSWLSSNNFK